MDTKTHIKSRWASRHATAGAERAPSRLHLYAMGLATRQVVATDGIADAAPHPRPITHECGSKNDFFGAAEIFKKTPCAAGLKPGGRYVAKDMPEVDDIPLLTKTLLDHGYPHGDSLTVADRMIAENLQTVTWNPDQSVARSADKPITVTGGVVGLKGNPVAQVAIGGPIALLEDGAVIEADADGGILNGKLTDEGLAARKTKWKPCATNHTSGALWTYAQRVGTAMNVAVPHPARAHEKQCYADI